LRTDEERFGAAALTRLREACADLCWLLSRGYAEVAALKLVGDRAGLDARQRRAVARCACSDAALAERQSRRLDVQALAGQPLAIDGMNILITLETAAAGGPLLRGRDGCLRDLAGVHGSYRHGAATLVVARQLGLTLAAAGAGPVCWILDRPVSRSGELAQRLRQEAERAGWRWEVALEDDADRALVDSQRVVLSADGWVLDRCVGWVELTSGLVSGAWVVDLSP